MGYLVLSRREGESIHLSIAAAADAAAVLEQLRAGIYIDVTQIGDSQVRVGIEAPAAVRVLRMELVGEQSG
jgi:sRNA-binding carbon storage regulator CsrA